MSAIGACFSFCGVLTVTALVFSFASLAPTEMALKYNYVLHSVNPVPVTDPGILFTGPFTGLIRFPKTIQTLDFSSKDLLDGRTQDGLPLVLGLAFQYRLLPDGIYNLYRSFDVNYVQVYNLVGIHIVTELATKFTAYQFFNEKQKIAEVMRQKLDEYFTESLYATVESLQINEDDLPLAFTETILTAATTKQNITRMQKTRDAKIVEFQTARLVAQAQANVTIQQALGQKARILQNGNADAAIIEAFVEAELQAYGKIHRDLGLSGDELIKYIWYDSLGGGGVASNGFESRAVDVLVGVNPSAYISQSQSG